MAVVKPPRKAANQQDKKIDAFIAGKSAEVENDSRVVTVRCSADWLQRVDEAAKKSGITRAAWIKYAASRQLDAEG